MPGWGLGPAAPESVRLLGGGAGGDEPAVVLRAMAARAADRRPLFKVGEREPLYLLILRAFTGILEWLAVELALSLRFLLARLQLFLLHVFVSAEAFW